jgi:hypothetical protein
MDQKISFNSTSENSQKETLETPKRQTSRNVQQYRQQKKPQKQQKIVLQIKRFQHVRLNFLSTEGFRIF